MKKFIFLILIAFTAFLEAYKIQPEDVLSIDVYLQSGEVVNKTVSVDLDGFTSLPYIGYVKVEGKNPKEIQDMIQKKVDRFLPSSIVSVYVEKPHPEWVYFHGVVSGAYDISTLNKEQRKLSSVLALVRSEQGNLTEDHTIENVKIIRDGQVINVNFSEYLKTGDEKYNPVLQGGDIVFTPQPMYVGVFGDDVAAGLYQINENTTLLNILAQARASMNPDLIKQIKVFRDDKTRIFRLEDLNELADFRMKDGDMVSVTAYRKIDVYVIGDISKRITLSERGHPTLRNVISNIGISFSKSTKWNIKLVRDGDVEDFVVENPEDLPEKPLRDMDIIVVKKMPEYVYIYGMITGRFDLSTLNADERRLSVVLSIAGGKETKINPESVVIIRGKNKINVNYWRYLKTGSEAYNPLLKPGDMIYTYGPREVLIYGNGVRQGFKYIKEGDTLFDVLVNSGVVFDPRITKSIELSRDGTSILLTVDQVDRMKGIELKDGDVIRVDKFGTIRLYIMGELSREVTVSESDNPTLKKLPAMIGLSIANGRSIEFKLIRNGRESRYVVNDFSKLPDVPLLDKDTIYISTVNPIKVYVNGVRSGEVNFSGLERADLKTLVYKLGLSDENLVVFVSHEGTTLSFDLKDVLDGKANLNLQSNDYVYITPYAFGKVYIYSSKVIKAGLKKPGEDIKNVLLRYGILPINPEDVKKIEVIRNGEKRLLSPEDVVNGKVNFPLKDGDFVLITPRFKKVVYVNGDISTVVSFENWERITKESLLAKLHISSENVKEIKGNISDGEVVWIRLKKNIRVYVYSRVGGSKIVVFGQDEDPSMVNFLSKVGMVKFSDKNLKYEISVLRNGKIVYEKVISYKTQPEDLSFEFHDQDFVRLDPEVINVYAFGWEVKQGRYVLPMGSNLKDFFALAGGIPRGSGTVRILRGKEIEVVNFGLNDIPDFKLNDGDVLIFDELPDNFVYVFGDVTKPGAIFTSDKEENLLKVLSLSGGLNGWESKREVVLIRKNGQRENLKLDYNQLLNVKVVGGDVVYVPARSLNRVYVLGAVRNPTVVMIDKETTLLEVIMRAGGFTKTAISSKVYVFRGGVKGVVEVYDMSWINGKKGGRNPELQPGDIVFVPDNPMMSINEMISLITPMIGFVDSSIRLYNDISGIIGR